MGACDIKPQNILLADDGIPKISDLGIAKQYEKPVLGITFGAFRSAPFTPPEDNSGEWICSRDCFSWAAVAVFCLTGKIPADYGELKTLAASLDSSIVPVQVLEAALSPNPSERPPLASALLAELDTFWDSSEEARQQFPDCHVQLDSNCLNNVMRALDVADRGEVEREIAEELNDVACGFRSFDLQNGRERGLRIFAVSWIFEAVLAPSSERLQIKRAWRQRAVEIERQRESAFRVRLTFRFGNPPSPMKAGQVINDLFIGIDSFEAEDRDRKLLWQRERVFRLWNAFLRAKADFEARRENAITFIDCKSNGNQVGLVTELPASVEIIGQSRLIRMTSGGHVFCDVIDVSLEEVVVLVTSGEPARIPRRGKLEINTVAAEKSIERQRRALDAVNYDRAASPRLKTLILDPGSCRAPTPIDPPTSVGEEPFDPEKSDILRRALGVQDVLAIQGPPGTGKTRLIEEILVQYLTIYPRNRVLLSAQTHVALDNVIERVVARQPALDVVRIGRIDDPKISPRCRQLVLDRKAQAWSEGVRENAHGYMTRWAEARGIRRFDIELGMLIEQLTLLLQRRKLLRFSLEEAEQPRSRCRGACGREACRHWFGSVI